jgi:diguanylate cyclase (GGDEF)-like protein
MMQPTAGYNQDIILWDKSESHEEVCMNATMNTRTNARIKWNAPSLLRQKTELYDLSSERDTVVDLIDSDMLTIHFQPIFSTDDGYVSGFEALTRFKDDSARLNTQELFDKAVATDTISMLDTHCREKAMQLAAIQGISDGDALLFINLCPETLFNASMVRDWADIFSESFAADLGIRTDRIVIEITEESAIKNYDLFIRSIDHFRKNGFKIAIDDFGVGYGGLKMLSVIEPDFVKIDRHFISNLDKALVKLNLVDAMATVCHRLGIKVIAEGIEREEELRTVCGMGIELLQGYHLKRPSPELCYDRVKTFTRRYTGVNTDGGSKFLGDISRKVTLLRADDSVITAINIFLDNSSVRGLPVMMGERIVGVLNRQKFLENQMLGKCGYGLALHSRKTVGHFMDKYFLCLDCKTTIEEASEKIQTRAHEVLYDDFFVTSSGRFIGIVSVSDLLDAITKKSLELARNANPLTGLPGNDSIYREVEKRLHQKIHFDACYIDLDNFKPYNDNYGFEKGDVVIKTLAGVMVEALSVEVDGSNFIGHIGGDDFIVITRPILSLAVCERIITLFKEKLPFLHGSEDFELGGYSAANRKGEVERYKLLSISIGIVSTEVYDIKNFPEFASVASEMKKAAKCIEGFSVVRDRRLTGQ